MQNEFTIKTITLCIVKTNCAMSFFSGAYCLRGLSHNHSHTFYLSYTPDNVCYLLPEVVLYLMSGVCFESSTIEPVFDLL